MARRPSDLLRAEGRALVELGALQRDPIFWGRRVPRGDGRLVLLVPGLFGNDLYLQPLHSWLRRIGYRTARSTLSVNAGCPDRLRGQVEDALARQRARRSGPVALIGHSRGGMLAWALASRLGSEASHLILVGSPAPASVAMMRAGVSTLPKGVGSPAVVAAGMRATRMLDPHCTVPACGCPYTEDLRRALDPATRVLAIVSRDDKVVAPESCRLPPADGTTVEVGGTHTGLVYNRAVYKTIAPFLAG